MYFLLLVDKIKSLEIILNLKKLPGDYCDILIMPIRSVTKAPIENKGLIDCDAENEAEPVLQLFADVQHDTTVPDVVEPVLEAVHVVPDATHEYVLVAVPADQAEEV